MEQPKTTKLDDIVKFLEKTWKDHAVKSGVSYTRFCKKYGVIEEMKEPYIRLCDLKECGSCRMLEKVIAEKWT